MSALAIRNVSTSFRTATGIATPVFQDLSLEIGAREFVVFLGPSGCGKTTLLNHVAGFTRPESGSIEVDGRSIRAPGPDRGVIFQQDALMPWLSVVENVEFGLRLRGVASAARRRAATDQLVRVELAEFAHHKVWELSGGMRQRVSLARALAADPKILLMDEPFGALDALTREQMQTLMLRVWRAAEKQVLLVTHDIEEAVFLATDLIMMSARPARVLARQRLDFGCRYAAGEPARRIKSDPAFIAMRERVLASLFAP
jgi:taurine transport system ATP-binding protein